MIGRKLFNEMVLLRFDFFKLVMESTQYDLRMLPK